MGRASKKQIAIISDLLTTAKHYMNETGLAFVILIDGDSTMYVEPISNVTKTHARAIIRDAVMMQDKLQEGEMESISEKLNAIPPDESEKS